jgi:hypothetical protein
MQVVSILLTTGVEWIAQDSGSFGTDKLSLKKVRKIQLVPDGKGGAGMALLPIFMANNNAEDFDLDTKFVVLKHAPHPEFEKQYLQEVSGIQLI